MHSKSILRAGLAGLITAFFVRLILINTNLSFIVEGVSLPLWALFIVLPIVEAVGYAIAVKLFAHIPAMRQLARFGIVGLMNFSVDAGIITVLSALTGIERGAELIGLNIASSTIAIINSYYWQRSWTFKETTPPTRKEFAIFVGITIIGIAINTFVVILVTGVLHPFDGLTASRLIVVAKILATIVSLVWNFIGYKFIVFR